MPTPLTQTDRVLRVQTPLGPDELALTAFSGQEEISRIFQYTLELASENYDIEHRAIVGKNVTFSVVQSDDETERYFNGFVSRFAKLPSKGPYARYRAEVVPWAWFLTRSRDCFIFQNKSVPDIAEAVFQRFGFSDYETSEIQGSHPEREFCVQYRETAYDFVERLLEEEGIFYFFRHENGKHTLVLADHKGAHRDCPFQSDIRMEPGTSTGFAREENYISRWEHLYEFRTGKWAQTDYNFKTPKTDLMTNEATVVSLEGNNAFEVYDYPGLYTAKGDGEKLTKLRMEEDEVPYDTVQGESDVRSMATGFKFNLETHESEGELGSYVLTSVTHSAEQSGIYASGDENRASYMNSFVCIPDSVPYRPARITSKPRIQGTQTAVVAGPAGEEIHTDEHGRVKVQFHWDREGKRDQNSSCWIRVAFPWAGKGWGSVAIPRIGQEVVVAFEEGDPDRPIIVGRVYNGENTPPYDLPGEQTKSTTKSNSSKGGGGFNEIRFEDKKGKEQIFIHAQRNEDVRVRNSSYETIGGNRHLIVGKSQFEKVKEDKFMQVKGDKCEDVDGSYVHTIKGDVLEKIEMSYWLDVTNTLILRAQNLMIDADSMIEMKTGGSKIVLTPGAIFIEGGPMVNINSAPAPPSPPVGVHGPSMKDPKAADTGRPGEVAQPPPPPKPPERGTYPYSPQAMSLRRAAETGSPFAPIFPN